MNQRFLTLCISVEDNVHAKTPETDTWRACMCVSVCQSDSMGWEEEDKEVGRWGRRRRRTVSLELSANPRLCPVM